MVYLPHYLETSKLQAWKEHSGEKGNQAQLLSDQTQS